jgi:hypothetical protein
MAWFSQNWVWVLFFVGMIAMHLFGHGGHGRHGGHRGGHDVPSPQAKTACNARRIKGLVIDIDCGITVPE